MDPKYMGLLHQVKRLPMEGRLDGDRSQEGNPYTEKIKVGADLHGDTGIPGFWVPLRICFLDVHLVGTDSASYGGGDPYRILS